MANPIDKLKGFFGSDKTKGDASFARGFSGEGFRTNSMLSCYPMDILSSNSEVNRAVKFTAYEYNWGATVGNGKEIKDKSTTTHKWACYLPFTHLSETDSHTYEPFESWGMGQVKKEHIEGLVNAVGNADVMPALQNAKKIAQPLMSKAAVQALQSFVGKDWNVARRNFANGKTINPLTSKIYSNSNLRTFHFEYPMIALNSTESSMINTIIRNFKRFARPSGGTWETSLASFNLSAEVFQHPCVWDVEFIGYSSGVSEIKDFLPKIKTCVLSDISVEYAGADDGSTLFFRDTGAPVLCRLSLTFEEMYINTSEETDQGY